MNIVICDDEKTFLHSIKTKINSWAEKTGNTSCLMLHCFTSSEDVLDSCQHGLQVDALFMDIQIPGELSGLAVAREIHNSNEYIPIVFITSYGQYAEEGYIVNALRYIRKPVSEQAIHECMNIIWNRWKLSHSGCITLDLPTQILRLPINSIIYLEVSGHYCIIKTADEKKEYTFKQSLDVIRQKLPERMFAQCHRSYVVNLMYVRHIMGGNVTMSDGESIKLGKVYQSQFIKRFRQFYLEGDSEK